MILRREIETPQKTVGCPNHHGSGAANVAGDVFGYLLAESPLIINCRSRRESYLHAKVSG